MRESTALTTPTLPPHTHRSPQHTENPALAAISIAESAAAATGPLKTDIAAFWIHFWAQSNVSLPSRPLIEAFWYGAQYSLAGFASNRTEAWVPPPGLYGPWTTSDSPSWNGDFTLDYSELSATAAAPPRFFLLLSPTGFPGDGGAAMQTTKPRFTACMAPITPTAPAPTFDRSSTGRNPPLVR